MLLEQAASDAIRASYLLQDGVAMGVGKRTADGAKLLVRQRDARVCALRSHNQQMWF
jgi:hypothetical protein